MPSFNISLSPATSATIKARTNGDGRLPRNTGRSGVIERDLDRYYAGIERTRKRLAKLFTGDEAAALCDNLNGVMLDQNPELSIYGIPLNVADGVELSGLAEKWNLDASAFLSKVNSLNYLELCAIADAVERFWLRPGNEPRELFQ